MKSSVLLFCLLIGNPIFAQNSEEKKLESLIQNMFEDVFTSLDTNKIDNYLTTDFILYEDGEVWNKESIYSMVNQLITQFSSEENKNHTFKRINTFKFKKTHIDTNSAWIHYENVAEFLMDENPIATMHWLESANFIRTEKGWKIQFMHSTPVKNNSIEKQ